MTAYLFSCENATCAVPEAYREIFRDSEDVVESAEGWEPGSLNLAQGFAMKFRTPLIHGGVTRLLIDLEREGEEKWSRFSLKLPETTRAKISERIEKAYREQLCGRIEEDLRRHSRVLHVMVHTDAEIDSRVTLESPVGGMLAEQVAAAWRQRLNVDELDVRHFRNSDMHALGESLCSKYPTAQYGLIRLKVSQSFFLEGRPWRWEVLKKHLLQTLPVAVADATPSAAQNAP